MALSVTRKSCETRWRRGCPSEDSWEMDDRQPLAGLKNMANLELSRLIEATETLAAEFWWCRLTAQRKHGVGPVQGVAGPRRRRRKRRERLHAAPRPSMGKGPGTGMTTIRIVSNAV